MKSDPRLGALLIGVVLSTVDSSALNLALPVLAVHFNSDAATVQWVVSLYLAGSALAFLPLAGLAGRIGTARVYRGSLLVFSLLSLALALSSSLPLLLALRFLQGVAGAGVVGLVAGMAAATFPDRKGWALGMVAGAVATGTLIGPPIGGLLVDFLGWRSIFLVNLPFGALAICLSRNLGELPGTGLMEGLRRAFRAPGFLLALLATALFFAQSFGTNLLWPFYMTAGGMSPSRAGLLLLIPPALLMSAAPWAGRLADRKGYGRVSLFGSALLVLGSWTQGISGNILPGFLGLGLGRAVFQAANNAAVLSEAPPETETVASGLLSVVRVTGQACGSLLAGSMWGALEQGGADRAFLISNLIMGCLAAAAGAIILWKRRDAPLSL